MYHCIGWLNVTKKRSKPKINLILAVAFAAEVCYFFVSFFHLRTEVADAEAEVDAIVLEAKQLQAHNAELQQLLDDGDLDAFVEKRARDEDLGYVYPDERVYYDLSAAGQVQ